MSKGQSVKVISNLPSGINHPISGVVKRVDGEYILVSMKIDGKSVDGEFYRCELELIE